MVEDDQPLEDGAFGNLLVTDLTNYAFPLLRYRIGDQGRLLRNPCECGLPFPLMDYVKGRVSDSIRLLDGTMISGEYWTTIFDDHAETIKSFQVVQRKDYSIEIQFEPFANDYYHTIEAVSQNLLRKLRGKARLVFRRTSIDVNENGKARFVKSEICER